ncbi:hypothetical protein D3C72_871900 [compost metagenome]
MAVRWLHHQAFAGPDPRAFTAQMVDGDVAGAAQQVGAELLDLHQRPPPETQEQILYQVGRRRPATDAPTHQRFHLRTLGEKHLEKMRTVSALLITLDIAGFGGESDHRFNTAQTRQSDWPAGSARPETRPDADGRESAKPATMH